MRRLSTRSSSNRRSAARRSGWRVLWRTIGWAALFLMVQCSAPAWTRAEEQREPVTMKVVTVNPSAEKTQAVPVRIDLPQEIKPEDILDKGELDLEFDDARGNYFVHKQGLQLAPKETRVFEVSLRDVWFIPADQLTSLRDYTGIVLARLDKSEYAEPAKQLGESIVKRLDEIDAMQKDDGMSRKSRIGAYRVNLQTIERIKEDLARLEKLLAFTGGPPVPRMLEESPLKSDAPSTTTTWLVIFLVVIFIGLLGGQFFFTWQRRSQMGQELSIVRQGAFGGPTGAKPAAGNGNGAGRPAAPSTSSRLKGT